MTSVNEALELFEEEGWTLIPHKTDKGYNSFLEQVLDMQDGCFMKDFHIPELLIFPGGTEFYSHPGYRKGVIILQDKASCLPVHILSPEEGSVVLDMCAAPGMKTTQVAAAIGNNGTVYAVERDVKRFEVLKQMVDISGAKCVKIANQDVLECNNKDFPDVDYIIVDPSCSGSGMVDRSDFSFFETNDPARLRKLAGFQIKILRSALTRYPTARKVVYSTCSLNPEENEDVVRQVLESNANFKLIPTDQFLNNQWNNFGSNDFGKLGKYCLYARPQEDLTNGFFLAVFEKLDEGEQNEFFNSRVLGFKKKIEQKLARKERKKMDKWAREVDEEAKGQQNGGEKDDVTKGKEMKNKERTAEEAPEIPNVEIENDGIPKKKKKKMIRQSEIDNQDHQLVNTIIIEEPPMKRKKKSCTEVANVSITEEVCVDSNPKKKKSKRHSGNMNDEGEELRGKTKKHTEQIQEVNEKEVDSRSKNKKKLQTAKETTPNTIFNEPSKKNPQKLQNSEIEDEEKIPKKKKKIVTDNQDHELDNSNMEEMCLKKKDKSHKVDDNTATQEILSEYSENQPKKKNIKHFLEDMIEEHETSNNEDNKRKKKKSAKRELSAVEEAVVAFFPEKKKEKRKMHDENRAQEHVGKESDAARSEKINGEGIKQINPTSDEVISKKKKKKKHTESA